MSDLISREDFSRHIKNVLGLGDEENGSDPEYMEGLNDCNEALMTFPTVDIMECARKIKEYCRDRDNLDEPCEDCPFHFYMGYKGHCRFKSFPSEWDLPEGEVKPNDNTQNIGCDHND